jgi:hypothetical protein
MAGVEGAGGLKLRPRGGFGRVRGPCPLPTRMRKLVHNPQHDTAVPGAPAPHAQRDPLVEYKLEGYQLFLEMTAQIRRNVIYNVYCFKAEKKAGGDSSAEGVAAGKKQGSRRKSKAAA